MPAVNAARGAEPAEEPAAVWYVAQHETSRPASATSDTLAAAQAAGYDLLTTPISTAHFQARVSAVLQDYIEAVSAASSPDAVPLPLVSPLTPSDTALTPDDTNTALIACASAWIDLASPDPAVAHVSRHVFNQEIAYAAFCGINNVLVQGPLSASAAAQYARAVSEALAAGPYLHLYVLIPMTGELESDGTDTSHLAELARPQYCPDDEAVDDVEDLYGSWDGWNVIRSLCNFHQRLSIALEIPRQLPSISLQSRWYSEPLRLLVLPRTTFLRNAKGYPVLSKPHQTLLTRYTRLRQPPWIVLSDVGYIPGLDPLGITSTSPQPEPTPAESAAKAREKPKDPVPHLRYLRHLQQNQPDRPPVDRFAAGYQDYLQSPLQPLTDNLESITYEVFEKDPVKYEWYERATAAALKDLRLKKDNAGDDGPVILAVVGAGRGPLVSRALQASASTGIPIVACAVEKNPNAHVLLQRRNAMDPLWNNAVLVIKSDMRVWPGPIISGQVVKVDILVSELLGSFADNELSPECLDGVQHVLHPDRGMSIPSSYTAHLTPIAAPRIHGELLSRPSADKWELPYVVMLHQYDYLSVEPNLASSTEQVPDVKQAWSFSHPLPPAILEQGKARAGGSADAGGSGGAVGGDGSNEHNARFAKLTFWCAERGVCHGLAGYFETVLYDGSEGKVELSTNPVTMQSKSRDMISWFPIFFPLKTPLYVPDGAEMDVSMWRQTDDRMVWYEWVVEVFHCVDGKKKRLGLSEVHSSRRNGCLT